MPGDASKIWPNPICDMARKTRDPFPTQICPRPNRSYQLEKRLGRRPDWGFVMSIEYPPHHNQARLDELRDAGYSDNVVPLHADNALLKGSEPPRRRDEFSAALSPLLEEAAGLQGDVSPRPETNDFLLLLEENARLRKLAVKLSNLLGDLPERGARAIEPGSSGGGR